MREHFIKRWHGRYGIEGRQKGDARTKERQPSALAGGRPDRSIRLPNFIRGSVLEEKRGKRGMVTLPNSFQSLFISSLAGKIQHNKQPSVTPLPITGTSNDIHHTSQYKDGLFQITFCVKFRRTKCSQGGSQHVIVGKRAWCRPVLGLDHAADCP